MSLELILVPIHRHDLNFYGIRGKFKIIVKQDKKNYIIELENSNKKIVIPKTNTVKTPQSLYNLEDNLIFFPLLHHDTGKFELIYIDRSEVLDQDIIVYY